MENDGASVKIVNCYFKEGVKFTMVSQPLAFVTNKAFFSFVLSSSMDCLEGKYKFKSGNVLGSQVIIESYPVQM